jgi:alpha-mannosidase
MKVKRIRFGVIAVALLMAALVTVSPGAARAAKDQGGGEKAKLFYETMVGRAGMKPSDIQSFSMGQSHIDAAWRWRKAQTRDKCIKTFSGAIEHMKMFPDFRFSQSAPQYYDWVKEDDPALFAQIQQFEKSGQWELVGPMWVEPDGNMPDGESWVRQNLLGQRFYKENFGHTADIGWMLDSFGYNWSIPQILAKSGTKYFWTNKLTWNDTTVFPFHYFWWQSPDGSRLLTYFIQAVSGPASFPPQELNKFHDTRYLLPAGAGEFVADYSMDYKNLHAKVNGDWLNVIGIFYGKGDGGHGPVEKEIHGQLALASAGYTKLSSAHELYTTLATFSDRAPVWNDELYLEYHQGCFTTHGEIKRANRQAEQTMRTAEVTGTIATRLGLTYAYDKLKALWKLTLLNQFHDILPGSSIPEVYQDAMEDYRQILSGLRETTDQALGAISGRIDTRGPEGTTPLVVMNTLSWERSGVVSLPLAAGEEQVTVVDREGRQTPAQVASSAAGRVLMFRAEAVPSVGYKVYYLKKAAPAAAGAVTATDSGDKIVLANDAVSIAVDKKTGWLSSVQLKAGGKEFLAGPSNRLRAWHDRSAQYQAWNIQKDYLKHPYDMPDAKEVKITAQGPLFVEVTATRKFKDSDISQVVRLYAKDQQVHLTTDFDFHDKNMLVKSEFNSAIKGDKIDAEIPYGVISRTTNPTLPQQKAMFETSVQRWMDESDGQYGLALVNNGKYGYSLNEDGAGYRLTLLKAAIFPTPAPEAVNVEMDNVPNILRELKGQNRITDQGPHTVWTALYPHAGNWKQARLWRAGYEFNTPLEVSRADQHPGALPAGGASFVSVSNPDVYLGAMKRAEDGPDFVLRLVEGVGAPATTKVSVGNLGKIVKAEETDLLEWNGQAASAGKDGVEVALKPWEIKTIKVSLGD